MRCADRIRHGLHDNAASVGVAVPLVTAPTVSLLPMRWAMRDSYVSLLPAVHAMWRGDSPSFAE